MAFAFRNYCFFILFLVLMIPTVSNELVPFSQASGTIIGKALPVGVGDWVIDQDTTVTDENILLNGSIIIQNGFNLTLQNVTLKMNSTSAANYGIIVNSGGELIIDNCTVTAVNSSHAWYLKASSGSSLFCRNSTFSYLGFNSNFPGDYTGFWINTNKAQVLNCTICNGYYGLYLYQAHDCLLANNTIIDSVVTGIRLYGSENNTLADNIFKNHPQRGISLNSAFNTTIVGNQIINASTGIWVASSDNNTLDNNDVINSSDDGISLLDAHNITVRENNVAHIGDMGVYISDSENCTLVENTINNCTNKGAYFLYSGNNTVIGNTVTDCKGTGIEWADAGHSKITDNTVTDSPLGLYFTGSGNCTIADNTITNSTTIGLNLGSSGNCTIEGNIITKSGKGMTPHGNGIYMTDSGDCKILANTITYALYKAIYIATSHNAVLQDNVVMTSSHGIYISGSDNASVSANTVTNSSDYGIYITAETNNCQLWLNNLSLSGMANGLDYTTKHQWDNGTHGNWWDDYSGLDLNQDGIGDTPYNITEGSGAQDRYPLLASIDTTSPTIDAPTDISYEETTVGHSITWQPADANPYWYNITQNGTVLIGEDKAWDGSSITVNIDGLSLGTYDYTITVYDRSGNLASDTVLVIVTEHTTPSSEPSISSEPPSDVGTRDTGDTTTTPGFAIVGVVLGIAFIVIRARWRRRN